MSRPDPSEPAPVRLRADVEPEREMALRHALRRNKERLFETLDAPAPAPRGRGWLAPTAILVAAAAGGLMWMHGRPTLTATSHTVTALVDVAQPAGPAAWDRRPTAVGERVSLHDGSLTFRTRGAGPKLRVVVPDGELEDVGTQFRVTVTNGRTTSIEVTEGLVVFHRHDAEDLRLAAGSHWQASASGGAAANAERAPAAPLPSGSARHAAIVPSAPLPSATAVTDTGEDAAYLRIVALVRENRRDEARVASQEYLRRYPNGFRRVEVEQLAR